jgi:hypothetical protein
MTLKRSLVVFGLIVCWLVSGAWLPGEPQPAQGPVAPRGVPPALKATGEGVDAQGMMQVKRLLAEDGVAEDKFGWSVALTEDHIVVGMPQLLTDETSTLPGAAYAFVRNAGGGYQWDEQIRLNNPDDKADDWFGYSVAISGDTAVIGAPHVEVDGNDRAGAAYVFTRDSLGDWSRQATLIASDGKQFDRFGSAVAVDDDTVAVGAPRANAHGWTDSGSAYIFDRDGSGGWNQTAVITATPVYTGDYFGVAVAVDGDTVVVGAYGDNVHYLNDGSAYVFSRDQGGADQWGRVKKITVDDAQEYDEFGISVSLDGDTLVVGAHQPGPSDGSPGTGTAYVFYLTASDGTDGDFFGYSVSVKNDVAIIGAPYVDVGSETNQGAAYLFARDEDGDDKWGQVAQLLASTGTMLDAFGTSVATFDGIFLAGAPYASIGLEQYQGAAYAFIWADQVIDLPVVIR